MKVNVPILGKDSAVLGFADLTVDVADELAYLAAAGQVAQLRPSAVQVDGSQTPKLIELSVAFEPKLSQSLQPQPRSIRELSVALAASRLDAAKHIVAEHRLRNGAGLGVAPKYGDLEQTAYEAALRYIACHLTDSVTCKDANK